MKIKNIYETAKETGSRIALFSADERILKDNAFLSCTITVNPERRFQSFEGFGGALTESSGYVLSLIPLQKREEVLEAYFSPKKGNRYTLARTHLNSCDFSLGNWACVEQPDESLNSFSMEKPEKYIVPLIKDVQKFQKDLRLLISPWSPPAWMKDNGDMNHGGKLQKKYYSLWADYFVRFINELKKRGIDTWAVSVQNEPLAKMVWDSCLWSAIEEGEFAAHHLGPALEKYTGTNEKIKIFVLDHNRDVLWDRFAGTMSVPGADKYIDGAAIHWYSGDQYDMLEKMSRAFPECGIIFTEGCIEGGPRPGAWFSGERYGHNIINDLNHGCTGWIDWNIALNMQGGPNHVGNFCDAPVLVDTDNAKIHYNSSFYYIGHFSRFILPQARRVEHNINSYMTPATVDGRMGNMMECCTFRNIDASLVLVVMNRTEADMKYELKINNDAVVLKCPPRGIQSLILET